ncbi:hypothetical protein [Corynebacterium halotolerans]|uniref:Uncharacterized protein n=1 Tax=Corynebacterium halotolerans YIM 70093 = DSM 44683 TaxID=1121362 RepID=M1NXX8_9CORY|nr:hypothetical protein [Corynebacterium halotolerans]AGF72355.1 hypothetical protein A605_06765 [Corynebacterium halotolerans YIM 70093 = DSM 44683]
MFNPSSPGAAEELRSTALTDRRVLDQVRAELDALGFTVERITRRPEEGGTEIRLAEGAVLWTGPLTDSVRRAPESAHAELIRSWVQAFLTEFHKASEQPEGPDLSDPAVLATLRIRLVPELPLRLPMTYDYARHLADLRELLCLRWDNGVALLPDQLVADEDLDHLFDIARRNMLRVPMELVDVSEDEDPVGLYVLRGGSALVSSVLPSLPSLVAGKFGPDAAPEGLLVAAPNRETLYATPVGDDTPGYLLRAVTAMLTRHSQATAFPSLYLVTDHSVDLAEVVVPG